MNSRKISRCAIYTRKSTEHNLDSEFNSLDAQREACEAYIKSQMHEGWRQVSDHYDDGGISGATLERPGLQRLLVAIRSGNIDTVVVYKVDRLTRSLTDFAKLVELFDAHDVSFVSVTQAFNTTSSMGRLTLNVLLSFAQFEREVIGERVKDKVAASKIKGLWMGGRPPLGYINQNKKLVIVPEEAQTIQWIFRQYLELGAIGPLLAKLRRSGIKSKLKGGEGGPTLGGREFGRGALGHLLKNRCYVGEVVYRGQIYQADHEPILERDVFDAVQALLAANGRERKQSVHPSQSLLAGLIFDSAGHRMSPHYTRKRGVLYRYYTSQAVLQGRKGEAGEVSRVPAPDVETLVTDLVAARTGIHPVNRGVLEAYLLRVIIYSDSVQAVLRPSLEPDKEGVVPPLPNETVSLPWARPPSVLEKGICSTPTESAHPGRRANDSLLSAIAKARLWVEDILSGVTVAEIAQRECKGPRQIRLLLPLAFVSPSSVRSIIDGAVSIQTATEMARFVSLVWF